MKKKNRFNPGMTVKLNSGGPLMTVTGQVNKNGYIKCIWFTKDHNICQYLFHESALFESYQNSNLYDIPD